MVAAAPPRKTQPDYAAIHQQLQKPHVALQLLWEEYREANPDGYRYSRFCELYQRWRRKQDVVLRQQHKPGERMFVDWAGERFDMSQWGTRLRKHRLPCCVRLLQRSL
jgi:transposase